MSSKIGPKQRRPAAVYALDQRKLKEFRQKAGLSLTKVQELFGISKSTLSAYENGPAVPPPRPFTGSYFCAEFTNLIRSR